MKENRERELNKMTKLRTTVVICLCVLLANLCVAQDDATMGLVEDKPADGPFVKTDRAIWCLTKLSYQGRM